MSSVEKRFVSANQLLEDSFKLADLVLQSEFKPTIIVGLWRGGAPIAIAVHEYFAYRGILAEHTCIRAKSYTGIDQQAEQVEINDIESLVNELSSHSKILLVDDIFDTGKTMESLITRLREFPSLQNASIMIACPWSKPSRNLTSRHPDFCLHQTSDWVVFPHELLGLSDDEITRHKFSKN